MLETPRMLLRPFQDEDVEPAMLWLADPEVFRFYTYGPYRSVVEAARRIAEYQKQFDQRGIGKCVVVEKATGKLIGDAGLMLDEDTSEIHVGYKFARSYWGRGLATEAAQAWIDYGFDQLRLERIAAYVNSKNAASLNVLRRLQFNYRNSREEFGCTWNVFERARLGVLKRRRPAARLLVIDATQRALLFRYTFKEGPLAGEDYWATPGGEVESGETYAEAAVRELFEETGIVVSEIGTSVAEQLFSMRLSDGEDVISDERFFVVRTEKAEISRDHWSADELEIMTDHKWWSVPELLSTRDKYYPEQLVQILTGILETADNSMR